MKFGRTGEKSGRKGYDQLLRGMSRFSRESRWGQLIRPYVERSLLRSLRRSLRGVYIQGSPIPPPFVLATNHHSFFDGHLVWLLFRHFGITGSLIISEENLGAFPVLEAVGALPTSRVREALRRLRQGEAVAIFPEGELRPAGPLGELARGAVWLAEKAGVPIVPAISRVWLRGYEHPEAYVVVGQAVPPDLLRLQKALEDLLSHLDGLYAQAHPRQVLPGFSPILSGLRSLEERLARLTSFLSGPRSAPRNPRP